jgi:hypothetical protein
VTLPDKLRIGLYEYAVSEVAGLKSPDGNHRWGQISYQYETIQVEADTTLHMKQVNLWHEALHSMLMQAGLHGIDLEEPIVIALGHALVGVVRNNPGLIAYTLEDAEPPPADKT